MSSKNDKNSNGGLSSAKAVLNEVFDIYRRSRHFSLKRAKPQLYDNILKEIRKYPLPIAIEALNIYIEAHQKDGKRPHPNYFLAICKRIKEEFGNNNVWGKTI